MEERISEIVHQNAMKHRLWSRELSENPEDREIPAPQNALSEDFNCPVCYEAMIPPDRKPITLYPCGHSICEECLEGYRSTSHNSKCPYCNVVYTKRAVNFSLLQVAEEMSKTDVSDDVDFDGELKRAEGKLKKLSFELQTNQKLKIELEKGINVQEKLIEHVKTELNEADKAYSVAFQSVEHVRLKMKACKDEESKLNDILIPLIQEKEIIELELLNK